MVLPVDLLSRPVRFFSFRVIAASELVFIGLEAKGAITAILLHAITPASVICSTFRASIKI
jgi:hypothetical protein